MRKLGELAANIQYGFTASANTEKVGPQFLRITDIQNGKVDWTKVPFCKCDEYEKYKLQADDILFARTGATTGKSFLIKECPDAVFASYLIRLQLKKDIHPGYIYQFFRTPSYWSCITQFTTGSTQGGFNASKLVEISVPVPPIPIQKHIASIMEKADAAWEKRRKANQLTERFLQSAFLETFGDPVTNPKGWNTKNIQGVCRLVTDGTHDTPDYHTQGIPLITSKNLKPNGLDFSDVDFISLSDHVEIIKRSHAEKGRHHLWNDRDNWQRDNRGYRSCLQYQKRRPIQA